MKKIASICSSDKCTGCSLCASVCPVSCISMRTGEMGHLYPQIDSDACIGCGLCVKSCPSISFTKMNEPLGAYAAWALDEHEYMTSASGGAASVAARHFLKKGGVVYGCTSFSADGWKGIRHIRVKALDDLTLLKGSKYIQSSILDVLPQIRKDVLDGIPVLFIGTPCQTAAVRALFREEHDNLFLMDLICHGTPSVGLFRKYINDYLNISPDILTSVSFRDSGQFVLKLTGILKGNGEEGVLYKSKPVSAHRTEDLYFSSFLDGFTYRESCYSCRYAQSGRVSDMTVGDFWELDSCVSRPDHGVSLIIPVTSKGDALLDVMRSDMNIYQRPLSEAVNGNEQLRHPKRKTLRIKLFRTLVRFCGLWVYYPIISDWLVMRRLRSCLNLQQLLRKREKKR